MTPREAIVAELYKHFQGREFTIKDVAARVPHTINWVRKVLQSTEGITLSRQEPILVRGIEASHGRKRGYYTFDPEQHVITTTDRPVVEELIRRRFKDKEFSAPEVAEQLGISVSLARSVIIKMRGIHFVRAQPKEEGGSYRKIYAIKTTSHSKHLETVLQVHFAGQEFTAKDAALKCGLEKTYVRYLLQGIRGVSITSAEERREYVPDARVKNIYTFKPVSTDKWVA